MAASCNSIRCTKCGRKKRAPNAKAFSLQDDDNESLEMEFFDALWSPLDTTDQKSALWPSQDLAQPPAKVTKIEIDAVTPDCRQSARERFDGYSGNTKGQLNGRSTRSSVRKLFQFRISPGFTRGMAIALGASMTNRSSTTGSHIPLQDFGDCEAVTSVGLTRKTPYARSILRRLLFRLNPSSTVKPFDYRPLRADYYENVSSWGSSVPF
jgi:hypothetical protein